MELLQTIADYGLSKARRYACNLNLSPEQKFYFAFVALENLILV